MTRDLFVASYTPSLSSGTGIRNFGVVRAMARTRPVDYLYAVFGADEPAPRFRALENVAFHPVHSSHGARRALIVARAVAGGAPPDFARGASGELLRAARTMAADPSRGRVIMDGPVTAASLFPLARRRPVVYNAHNVESLFRHDVAGGRLGSPKRLEAYERRVLETASESWMVSRRDMEAAARIAPGAALRLVPNVVDATAIEPVTALAPEPRAIFVGDFTYRPNRDGFEWLVGDVLPRLWERLPEARLSIVGKGLDGERSPDERAELLGFVDDLAAEYARSRAAVVPLLAGGGSPLKFVEALAYGLPVVATPAAAAGLDAEPGRDFVLADGAQAFADALATVLEHGDAEMGARARALVEREYSVESLTTTLAT